ncbi:hypothetical protein TVAG_150020 [Trichomonas vaginalis G3]|uniref:Uncharacterized protein n=1 Tax=Trichomonas vaginalis (strain ATCC PRA-98 / G3) TaxID=412133 RepID=A2DRQ4_TRIV3|nr:armadillo (ARM) repeat-containing protein family [Trichomonas vaginalis G3]EAY16851.1 hypothetical protein TVAG_150020 [Trichomonas vaginalis G3]KAI5489160.1 armadillo (ARM) repeat-containing protein family [Trichomonas vaginalis G3]|eukprot:XP_001329074.1 hypothetical protein [Trichomonas vaginalis G3]
MEVYKINEGEDYQEKPSDEPIHDKYETEMINEQVNFVHSFYQDLESTNLQISSEQLLNFARIVRTDCQEILNSLQDIDFIPLLFSLIDQTKDFSIITPALNCICLCAVRFGIVVSEEYLQILINIFQAVTSEENIDISLISYLLTAISICSEQNTLSLLTPEFYQKIIQLAPQHIAWRKAISNFFCELAPKIQELSSESPQSVAIFYILLFKDEEIIDTNAKIIGTLLKKRLISLNQEEFLQLFFEYFKYPNTKILTILFNIVSELDERELPVIKSPIFVNRIKEIIGIGDNDEFTKLQCAAINALTRLVQIYPLGFRSQFIEEDENSIFPILMDALNCAHTNIKRSIAALIGLIFDRFPDYFMDAIMEGQEQIIEGIKSVISLEDDSTIIIINGIVKLIERNPDFKDSLVEHGISEQIVDIYEETTNETLKEAIDDLVNKSLENEE